MDEKYLEVEFEDILHNEEEFVKFAKLNKKDLKVILREEDLISLDFKKKSNGYKIEYQPKYSMRPIEIAYEVELRLNLKSRY